MDVRDGITSDSRDGYNEEMDTSETLDTSGEVPEMDISDFACSGSVRPIVTSLTLRLTCQLDNAK